MNCAHCSDHELAVTDGGPAPYSSRVAAEVCGFTGLPCETKVVFGCPLDLDLVTHHGRAQAHVLLTNAAGRGKLDELAARFSAVAAAEFGAILASEELAAAPIHGVAR